jgi:hypothetical protein
LSRFQTGRLDVQQRFGSVAPKTDEAQLRSRVERRKKTVRLPVQKLDKWEVWCAVAKLDFQDLVEEAIDFYLNIEGHLNGRPDAQTPSYQRLDDQIEDEKDLSSSSSLFPYGRPDAQEQLLGFYAEKTGNVVKERDRDAYREVAELPEAAVRYGIMQSVLLCKTRVNSFRYCVGAIREAADANVSQQVVAFLMATWARRIEKKNRGNQIPLPAAGAEVIEPKFRKERL